MEKKNERESFAITIFHATKHLKTHSTHPNMPSSIQWFLTVAVLFMSENGYNASGFSVPDAFHAVHTATSSASTVHTVIQHQSYGMINLLDMYKHSLLEHPLGTKMATGATMAVAGDAIAQSRDVDAPYDKRRATSFAAFDSVYRACQHALFPVIVQHCHGQFLQSALSHVTIVDQHAAAAMEQTLASQLGIVPLIYYPAFFAVTGAVQGLDLEGAVNRAKETFLPLMKRNLCFWIPVQFVQFGFIQEDLQIPVSTSAIRIYCRRGKTFGYVLH